jgi:fucose permease
MARAMLVPLACYIFIAYFAWIGSRIRLPGPAAAPVAAEHA